MAYQKVSECGKEKKKEKPVEQQDFVSVMWGNLLGVDRPKWHFWVEQNDRTNP